jgi:predicted dehydrogenase
MKTLCVIGLGSIGMRHAKNLADMGHRVLGIDPDENKTNELEAYTKEVPPEADIDAYIVCNPTDEHAFEILTLLTKRPMFVEKPIGASRSDKIEIEAALRHAKNPLMVGYNLRFHSCVERAKEWMPNIGQPLWANFTVAQYNDKPSYLRDGVVLNWSHELDLCLYLLGGGSVAGSSTRLSNGHDDITDILITHDNGCRSSVHLDYITEPQDRTFKIIGTKGQISVDLLTRNMMFEGDDKVTPDYEVGNFDTDYIKEMKAFIDRIDGKQTLGCTGEEALKVLDICLEVRKQAGLL